MSASLLEDSKRSISDMAVDFNDATGSKEKNKNSVYNKRKRKSGRKCKICGKDPYPNYFFCPACHHKIDSYEEGDV